MVDPSILLLVPETTPVFYFPGLTYTYAEAEALEGEVFPHVRFDGLHGADGLGHPGYRAAREAARRKVYTLACARRPPKAMQFLTAQEMEEMCAPEAGSEAEGPRTLVVEGLPLDLPRSREISRANREPPASCRSKCSAVGAEKVGQVEPIFGERVDRKWRQVSQFLKAPCL